MLRHPVQGPGGVSWNSSNWGPIDRTTGSGEEGGPDGFIRARRHVRDSSGPGRRTGTRATGCATSNACRRLRATIPSTATDGTQRPCFLAREVKRHVADGWIDSPMRTRWIAGVGMVGCPSIATSTVTCRTRWRSKPTPFGCWPASPEAASG